MGLSQHGYLILCYCLSLAVLVGVAAFALAASWLLRKRTQTADDFITARGQASAASHRAGCTGQGRRSCCAAARPSTLQPSRPHLRPLQFSTWRIAWSMWASAVGAWVIAAPASYSPYAGIVGMLM